MIELFIGIVVLVLVMGIAAAIGLWRAFVLMKIWAWVIVPTFALPPISVAAAFGIALLVGMFSPSQDTDDWSTEKKVSELFVKPILSAGIALLIGYILKGFI